MALDPIVNDPPFILFEGKYKNVVRASPVLAFECSKGLVAILQAWALRHVRRKSDDLSCLRRRWEEIGVLLDELEERAELSESYDRL